MTRLKVSWQLSLPPPPIPALLAFHWSNFEVTKCANITVRESNMIRLCSYHQTHSSIIPFSLHVLQYEVSSQMRENNKESNFTPSHHQTGHRRYPAAEKATEPSGFVALAHCSKLSGQL